MKAWKVFCQHKGKLLSASYYNKMQPYIFEYSLTKKNVPNPKFGPFFCFKTKMQAEKFARDVLNPVIRKVKIEPAKKYPSSICFYPYEVEEFWENFHAGSEMNKYYIIEGTIFADSLIILEE